jgi:hypothetical protein
MHVMHLMAVPCNYEVGFACKQQNRTRDKHNSARHQASSSADAHDQASAQLWTTVAAA